MQTIGLGITAISGAAIAVIGLLYLSRPRAVATSFGLPVLPQTEATWWLRVKGIRDLASGIAAAVLLISAPPAVIGWVLVAFALIPLGDAATIVAARGRLWAAVGIHGVTAAVMLVGAALLILGR